MRSHGNDGIFHLFYVETEAQLEVEFFITHKNGKKPYYFGGKNYD
jgi:hypothetical protein